MYVKDWICLNHRPKMGETGKHLNSIYFASDPLKEIFLRLPRKSLVKFKTVSEEWRSILESKSFIEMHLSFQKSGKSRRRKILAAYKCGCSDRPSLSPESQFEGDEEIVYLHGDTIRPSMSCDGLVCIPEPGWVNVLNPSTGEHRRFPSGPDRVFSLLFPRHRRPEIRVTGSYKVVRMCFDPVECDILDVQTGKWRKLRPPPYEVDAGRRSACVNGSIYWLEIEIGCGYKMLALDLHTEEFHDVTRLPGPYFVVQEAQKLNLDDRLAISMTIKFAKELEIWSMDPKEERRSKTYSINLADVATTQSFTTWWFTPVAVSKEGNVLICDDKKILFKHYQHTNTTRRLSPSTCWVISPYLANLVGLHQN